MTARKPREKRPPTGTARDAALRLLVDGLKVVHGVFQCAELSIEGFGTRDFDAGNRDVFDAAVKSVGVVLQGLHAGGGFLKLPRTGITAAWPGRPPRSIAAT